MRKYLGTVDEFEANHSITTDIDEFQHDVINKLDKLEIHTRLGYMIAGTEVDILCRHNGNYLAIDLIGFPWTWADFFELNSYKLFKRVGVEVLPISYGL